MKSAPRTVSMGSPGKAEDSHWDKDKGSWCLRKTFLGNWAYLLNDLGSALGEPSPHSSKKETIKPKQQAALAAELLLQQLWRTRTWGQWHGKSSNSNNIEMTSFTTLLKITMSAKMPRKSMSHQDPQERGVRDVWGAGGSRTQWEKQVFWGPTSSDPDTALGP